MPRSARRSGPSRESRTGSTSICPREMHRDIHEWVQEKTAPTFSLPTFYRNHSSGIYCICVGESAIQEDPRPFFFQRPDSAALRQGRPYRAARTAPHRSAPLRQRGGHASRQAAHLFRKWMLGTSTPRRDGGAAPDGQCRSARSGRWIGRFPWIGRPEGPKVR